MRFTVLTRNNSPKGNNSTLRKRISKGTIVEGYGTVKSFDEISKVIKEERVSLDVLKEIPGEVVLDELNVATFRWDLKYNNKWYNLIEIATAKELSVIPDSIIPTLNTEIKKMSKWDNTRTSLEVYMSIADLISLVRKTNLLVDLNWVVGGGDLTTATAVISWYNGLSQENKP